MLVSVLIFFCTSQPGKHRRGTGGAAPVSDAAGRGEAQGTPLPARPAASGSVGPRGSHVGFFDARRREPIRAESGLNRPVSAGIGWYRPISAETAETADSGRNSKKKKKKKKTQNAPFTKL